MTRETRSPLRWLLSTALIALCASGTAFAAEGKRFHPGFYIEGSWNGTNGLLKTSRWMWEDPDITGVYLPLTWAVFEENEGEYNFALIDELLRELEKSNKYLVVQIYHHGNNKVPKYLINQGGVVKSPNWGGDTPMLWKPWVMDKIINALKALGDRYDDHPLFEGTMISEFPNGAGSLYDCMDYTNEWVRMIKEVSEHYKNAVYFAQTTFTCGNNSYDALKQAMVDHGAGVSTTDLLRGRSSHADEMGQQLKGVIPFFAQGDTTYLSRDLMKDTRRHDYERYEWGVESGVTHFGIQTFWFARQDEAPYSLSEYQTDIMNLLPNRHREFGVNVNDACPTAIEPCNDTTPGLSAPTGLTVATAR